MIYTDASLRSSSVRILWVLEMAPLVLSNSSLVLLCGEGMGKPVPSIHKALRKLRDDGLLASLPNHKRDMKWTATRWSTEPKRVIEMGESLRESLPLRRRCITQTVKIRPREGNHQTVHYSVGLYPDGRPAELFIDVSKAGAALKGWCGEAGMMLSIALQHGTPLQTILDLFIGTRNDPSGEVTGHPRITQCTSIMDLIARDMAITFLQREDLADTSDWSTVPVPISDKGELPVPIKGQVCVCHRGAHI